MKIPQMQQSLRRRHNILYLFFAFLLYSSLHSCVLPKRYVYFNNLKKDTLHPGVIVQDSGTVYEEPIILTNDVLSISIQTLAQNEGNELISNSNISSDLMSGFHVDKNGYVELSLIGFVKVAGLTTTEARELIKQKAKEYYKDPLVNVRIANFDVMVLGDVNKPGLVKMPTEKTSIIDVIALAGDLAPTAKRNNILLVRTEGDKTKFVRLDVTSSDIFKSPYFYVKQRDYIYVEQSNSKRQTSNNILTRYLGVASSLVGVVSLLLILIR